MFDVKMYLTRKVIWVLDGHRNTLPEGSAHARVVSLESVRISFTYAVLRNPDVWACDVQIPAFKILLLKITASSLVKSLS